MGRDAWAGGLAGRRASRGALGAMQEGLSRTARAAGACRPVTGLAARAPPRCPTPSPSPARLPAPH
jgi:hypothetical protein